MKKFYVTMECHTLISDEFEAETLKEAIEQAKNDLRGKCNGDNIEFYEATELGKKNLKTKLKTNEKRNKI